MTNDWGATHLACDCIFTLVLDEVLVRFHVVLPVLLHDILADIAVRFLHPSSNLQLILGRDGCHLSSFSHQVQHELTDIPACDRNMLDRTSDDVPLSARDNVGDTIARINNSSGKRTISNLVGGPGGSEGEHCLDGDIETLDIERFEKYFRGLLSVLRGVERRLGLKRVVEVSRFEVRSKFRHTPARSSDPQAQL